MMIRKLILMVLMVCSMMWVAERGLVYAHDNDDDQNDDDRGAEVTRSSDHLSISNISPSVGNVNTQRVEGDISGTLRIQWGGHGDRVSPVSAPGAPELPANLMFGYGFFMIGGFGLLLYRKIW